MIMCVAFGCFLYAGATNMCRVLAEILVLIKNILIYFGEINVWRSKRKQSCHFSMEFYFRFKINILRGINLRNVFVIFDVEVFDEGEMCEMKCELMSYEMLSLF